MQVCFLIAVLNFSATPTRVILAFSLYTNTVEIFAAKNRPGAIGAVHCIRCFSMVWVMAGHVFGVILAISSKVQILFKIACIFDDALKGTNMIRSKVEKRTARKFAK